MGHKFGGSKKRKFWQRKVVVETQLVVHTVKVLPDSADYLRVEDVVRGLGRQYVAITREIEPLIGKSYSREYFHASIGRMQQITNTIAMLTGRDAVSVGASLDRERVYNTHGEQVDLELDDCFDSYRIAHS